MPHVPCEALASKIQNCLAIFLPKTTFPMRGNLPTQEPERMAWWKSLDLYAKQRKARQNRPLFVLQDGPPYSNGNIHMGHALNKILKDTINRWRFMKGDDIAFVPGWDCHGLPIENQVEKDLKQQGLKRQELTIPEFRAKCRHSAHYWTEVQKASFQRLGISADWDHPYSTMDHVFEAHIAGTVFRLLEQGYIYRGLRPVWWSAAEQTALAEAEVEYKDIVSPSIFVRFPLAHLGGCLKDLIPDGSSVSALIWTTTPWSLPGNRAIAYGPEVMYGLYRISAIHEGSLAQEGEIVLCATELWPQVQDRAAIAAYDELAQVPGEELAQVRATHPLAPFGYDKPIPFIPSEFVTLTMGTGLVHTAPAHGVEDFTLGKRWDLDLSNPLTPQGTFCSDVPLVGSAPMESVYKKILKSALKEAGALLAQWDYTHSYPHSWRSNTPLFYYLTPQWFLAMDHKSPSSAQELSGGEGGTLRAQALASLSDVIFFPANASRRMTSMLEQRPDWCLSRQRVWGVPMAFFLNKESGEILRHGPTFQAIQDRIAKEGCDFWFTDAAYEMLPPGYSAQDWQANRDIVDVWLESGLVSEIVLKQGVPQNALKPISWPADLYLEGSDQHRAWFQSSLVLSQALNGSAPYKAILTHGYILDEKGLKMSKSQGNVMDPMALVQEKGADMVRLWAVHTDYQKDVTVGKNILARTEDIYRRLRNTLRFLLGALQGIEKDAENSWLSVLGKSSWTQDINPLHQWMVNTLWQVEQDLNEAMEAYDFHKALQTLHVFCNEDLSAFYFPVIKDALYCDDLSNPQRQSLQAILLCVTWCLCHWLAPFAPFTSEEAWQVLTQILGRKEESPSGHHLSTLMAQMLALMGHSHLATHSHDLDTATSIHLCSWPNLPDHWALNRKENKDAMEAWACIRAAINKALEAERSLYKEALNSHPSVVVHPQWSLYPAWRSVDICGEHVCLTSGLTIVHAQESHLAPQGVNSEDCLRVSLAPAKGEKCQRCWKISPHVRSYVCVTSGEEYRLKMSQENGPVESETPLGVLCPRCYDVAKRAWNTQDCALS